MQALKEWAVVCRALEEGRQTVLLRKGGIMEYRQGFEVKHDRFFLFPTFEHQAREHLQPDYSENIDVVLKNAPAAGTSTLASYAEVKDVKEITDRSILKRLDDYHVWNESYVNARMDYNPRKPMSVIVLRVFNLDRPILVDIKPEWAGCKSWIPVDIDIAEKGRPALDDVNFNDIASEIREALAIAV